MFTALIAQASRKLLSEEGRELPVHPLFFGVFTFAVFMLMLYLVLRLDRD